LFLIPAEQRIFVPSPAPIENQVKYKDVNDEQYEVEKIHGSWMHGCSKVSVNGAWQQIYPK
jgi:hypothetical protein